MAMSELSLLFSSIETEYMHSKVRVHVLKDLPSIDVEGLKIGPYEKDSEVYIPRWLAIHLENKNIVKQSTEDTDVVAKLQTILWEEENERKLTQLDEDFFVSLRHFIKKLRVEITENPEPEKLALLEKISLLIRDILSLRLQKIVKLAVTSTAVASIKGLTKEEVWLYENLRETLKEWQSLMLSDGGT